MKTEPVDLESSSVTTDLEKRLALVVTNTEEPFIIVGTDLSIIAFNEKFDQLYHTFFGIQVQKGACILDYAQKDKAENLRKIYEKVFSGETHYSELEINNFGPESHWFTIKYKAAYDENGKIIGAFVSAVDTCAIKKSQQQLSQSEKRYRALVENGRDVVAILRPDGSLSYVSPSVRRVLGYTEGDLLQIELLSLIHPQDVYQVTMVLGKLLKKPNESFVLNKIKAKHKDGSWRWYEFVFNNLVTDPDICGITAVFHDITEIVEAELTKEFDHNNLSALINNTQDLMWSISLDGTLISSNTAFNQTIKLFTGKEVVKGTEVPTIGFSEESITRWKEYYQRAFSGEIFTIVDYNPIPVETWAEISFYPIRNGQEIVGTACYSRNITERKLSECRLEAQTRQLLLVKHELEYSELRLKQAQAIAHVGSWEVDFATNSSIWSDEAYKIYGLDPGNHKLSYDDWIKFIHPEDVEGFKQEMKRHREEFGESSYQHRIVLNDGTVKYVVSESRFEFNSAGLPTGLYGVVHDVTERVKAEKEIVKSHSLLKKLTDNVPLAIYQFEIDEYGQSSFPFMSEAILQLVPSVDREKIKNDASSIFAAIHPDDLSTLLASIEQSKNELSNWSLEFRVSVQGQEKWINGFSVPQRKTNGTTVWYGYLQDVTEKRKYVSDIRSAKERYDLIAKATNDALYDWDLLTNKVYRSGDGLNVLFGYGDPSEINQPNFWQERIHPKDAEICYDKLKKILANPNESICNQEYRFRKADGTYAYVFDKGIVIRNEHGVAERMIGATQDITKLKHSELLLKELNERLAKRAKELALSNAELEQFAYIASHDLQEPLRMVTSFLTQLEKKYQDQLDDKARQYIFFATDGAARMRRLILDLLEYSRVGTQVSTKNFIDANQLIAESVKVHNNAIEETKAVVNWNNLPRIHGCQTKLQQVFQNLIGNALKYQKTSNQPVISISCSETDTHWKFIVSDNGIGIEEKYYEKIFTVFQRLHNKNEYSGTGIGLAICKKIVESHDGQIWVESNYGSGSNFYFTIAKPNEPSGNAAAEPTN